MFRLFFILQFFVFYSYLSFGQSTSIGLQGGLNFCNLYGEALNDDFNKFKISGEYGLALIADYHDNFGLEVDLLYQQKGMKYEGTYQSYDTILVVDNEFRMNYLTLPILFKVKYKKVRNLSFDCGVFYSMLLNAKEDVEVKFDSKYRHTHFGVEDGDLSTADNDYGLILGLGYQYPIFNGNKLGMGLRYYYGLQNIDMEDHSEEKVRSGNLSISVSILFSNEKNNKNSAHNNAL